MKKIYLLLGLSVALLSSCDDNKNNQYEFNLTGKFAKNDLNGKDIYIQKLDDSTDQYISIDTIKVENGTFTTKGNADNQLQFITGEGISKPILFIAEAGNIEMTIDTAMQAILRGTSLNEKWQTYTSKRAEFNSKMSDISKEEKQAKSIKKQTPEEEAKIEKEYDDRYNLAYNELRDYNYNFIKENITNAIGQYVFLDRGRSFDLAQLKDLISISDDKIKAKPGFSLIDKRYQALETTSVGNLFVDLKGNSPSDKPIALSDFTGKGNIVLIDFWASWCPPCRKEMPHVVDIYKKYKNKGFEIVGVSLDTDKSAWEKAIKDFGITWPQISDLKGWKTELGATYAVNSIPHMVLIDKDGKILQRGFNANELEAKLSELLK